MMIDGKIKRCINLERSSNKLEHVINEIIYHYLKSEVYSDGSHL